MKYTCRTISSDDDGGGRSFVGVFKSENDYIIKTPYGLLLPETISTTERENVAFLKKYAKCITKALSNDKKRQSIQSVDNANSSPYSALNIVVDYIQNGLYREFETEKIQRTTGKIDFKSTVAKIKPIIVSDEAYYTSFVVDRKRVSSQEVVSLAQANAINHFMENGGEILFGNMLHINAPAIRLDNNLIYKLQREKSCSFNSRKQQLIQWIIDYIRGASSDKSDGKWRYAIIASTLWEEMIDACYSNQRRRNKSLYGRQFTMHKIGKTGSKKSKPTEHDTIYEDENTLMIIDAKMYQDPDSLNNEGVLGKQFGYYETAHKKLGDTKHIYNILIKPYVPGIDSQIGFEAFIPYDSDEEQNGSKNLIYVYCVEFSKVMNAFYYGKKLSGQLLKEILMMEADL